VVDVVGAEPVVLVVVDGVAAAGGDVVGGLLEGDVAAGGSPQLSSLPLVRVN